MGSGIEAARKEAPEHAQALENFRDQLLIALLRRCAVADQVVVPIAEVDETGGFKVLMSVADGNFNFKVVKNEFH